MGQFVLGESQSRLYPHMRAKFGRGPTAVSKKVSFKFISRYLSRCLSTIFRTSAFVMFSDQYMSRVNKVTFKVFVYGQTFTLYIYYTTKGVLSSSCEEFLAA